MLTVIIVSIQELLTLLATSVVSILQATDYTVPVILLRLMLNTTSSLQGFYLETLCFLLMSLQCMTQIFNLSVCYWRLINHLQLSVDNLCSYYECVLYNLMCCVDKESDKCLKCVQATHHKCDLVISKVR